MATNKHKITQVRDALTFELNDINDVIRLDLSGDLGERTLSDAAKVACTILEIVFECDEQKMRKFLNCSIITSEKLKAANMFMEDVL